MRGTFSVCDRRRYSKRMGFVMWNDWKEFAGDVVGVASLFVILFGWMIYATAMAPEYAVNSEEITGEE